MRWQVHIRAGNLTEAVSTSQDCMKWCKDEQGADTAGGDTDGTRIDSLDANAKTFGQSKEVVEEPGRS